MRKIVILDGHGVNPGDLSWAEFGEFGDVTLYDRTSPEQAAQRVGDAEIALSNKVPFTKEVLEKCPNLEYIGVLATGYNIVDPSEARARGVTVTNIPAYSTQAVAQMVFALLLDIALRANLHSQAVYAGEWAACPDFCFWKTPLIELAGKTLGIVGFGQIGQAVARVARALGMRVLYNRVHPDPSKDEPDLRYAELEELFAASDVISLNCPLTEANKGMINRASIAKMKDGVILINTARGALVVEQDLKEALQSGKVYAAAADVVSQEPILPHNPLLSAPNMLLTPHIAWAPKDTRQRLLTIALENLRAYLRAAPVNVVN